MKMDIGIINNDEKLLTSSSHGIRFILIFNHIDCQFFYSKIDQNLKMHLYKILIAIHHQASSLNIKIISQFKYGIIKMN